MRLGRITFYTRILFRNIFSLKGVSAILSSFGALWLCIEIADYFFKSTSLPETLQHYWWAFLLTGVLVAIWICRPISAVEAKLKDRDVTIAIAVGDIFTFDGAIVVGSNSTFDTRISRELIAEKSVQGQFTRKYYGDEVQLDAELTTALRGLEHEQLPGRRIGKANRYPIGTVVRLNPRNRTGYLTAIAHINEHGVASGNFEDLKQSLGQLWVFIGERGLKGSLVTPVLGSGFTRLSAPRDIIVQEIIKSFVAACSERTFCEKLTIVLAENDVLKNEIDLAALGDYLHHVSTYTEFAAKNLDRVGTPVGT